MKALLTITARAAEEIHRAAAASGAEGMALRLAAKEEPDGSLRIGMGFDGERVNDERVETAGVSLLVSRLSRDLLENATLDFVELGTGGHGFVVYAPSGEEQTAA